MFFVFILVVMVVVGLVYVVYCCVFEIILVYEEFVGEEGFVVEDICVELVLIFILKLIFFRDGVCWNFIFDFEWFIL